MTAVLPGPQLQLRITNDEEYMRNLNEAYLIALNQYNEHLAAGRTALAGSALKLAKEIFGLMERK